MLSSLYVYFHFIFISVLWDFTKAIKNDEVKYDNLPQIYSEEWEAQPRFDSRFLPLQSLCSETSFYVQEASGSTMKRPQIILCLVKFLA